MNGANYKTDPRPAYTVRDDANEAANDERENLRIVENGRKADRVILFVLAVPVLVYVLVLIVEKLAGG